jgi:hypothetical protein
LYKHGVYGYEYYRRGKQDPLPDKDPLYMKKKFLENFQEIDYICKMNYFKWFNKDGEVMGVGCTEPGCKNEISIMDYLMDEGYTIVKITEQEYNDYDEGDEVVLSKT